MFRIKGKDTNDGVREKVKRFVGVMQIMAVSPQGLAEQRSRKDQLASTNFKVRADPKQKLVVPRLPSSNISWVKVRVLDKRLSGTTVGHATAWRDKE